MRGFSLTKAWMEEYKVSTAATTQKKKKSTSAVETE